MQDENIGKRCCVCNLKDYLPYNCKNCNKIFCHEHYLEHGCKIVYQPPRPLQRPQEQEKIYRCSTCKTKVHEINYFYCSQCEKLYCLKHRYQNVHECKERFSCIIY